MRINLIYGEDTKKSYEVYTQTVNGAKSKGFEIISIKSPREVVGQSLFDEKMAFLLRDSKKVNIKDWKWLKENAKNYNSNLLIYYEGNVTATVIRSFPKDAKLQKFELPKILFAFLDNLTSNNMKVLKMFNELAKIQSVELVFVMMARQFRDLYWAKTEPTTMDIPDWRVLKVAKQAEKYKKNKLKRIINKLSEIDIKTKTSDIDLKTELDLFLIEELK